MNPAEIFAPIASYQMQKGQDTTYKEISERTGIGPQRLAQIKKNPAVAKVMELEALTREYHFQITIK